VAFSKKDGKVVWKSQNDQTAYSAPFATTLAGERQLLVFTAEALISLSPTDGKLFWRIPLNTPLGRHVTTPTVWKDTVMVASHQIGMVAVRVQKSGDQISATEAWTNKKAAMNFASPVVAGNHVYGIGPSKNVICVDAATGEIAWEKTGVIQTSADRAGGAFIVFGPNILLLTDSGELVMFAADPKEYREVGRTQVSGKTWCNPAYADGRLYLRDERELICVDLLPDK
jgi:outer membrane protein assembly factor BamB